MSNTPKNNEEEVDLGSLFVIIGRGFTNFFNFIGRIFKGLFDFLIQILLFVKTNIIKIGIGALIGALVGLTLEFKGEDKFESSLQVQPNFDSARQLYNNIGYYNDLVKQENFDLLSKTFTISLEEASSLKKFEIYPIVNENDILSAYDELIKEVDTATVKSYSYSKFKNMFTGYDYKIHNIRVVATQSDIFKRLDNKIISSIIDNEYFNKLKSINKENLHRTDSLLRKDLVQADSLHYVYKKVLLEEAKKNTSGTNIDLGGNGKKTSKELALFETSRELNEELEEISEAISEKSEIINVISNFQPVGHKVTEIRKNKAFQYAIVGSIIVVLGLLLLQLNSFLDRYKK